MLSVEMISVNQIAGFFKVYLKKKKHGIKLIFGLYVNNEFSYKLIILFLVDVARHAQSIQNEFIIT